jgi:hypothetical protein
MKFALGTMFIIALSAPGVVELNHSGRSRTYEVWLNHLGSVDIKRPDPAVEFFT